MPVESHLMFFCREEKKCTASLQWATHSVCYVTESSLQPDESDIIIVPVIFILKLYFE